MGLLASADDQLRCRFQVVGINPPAPAQASDVVKTYLKLYNTETGAMRAYEKTAKPKEKACIFLQLVCRDSSLVGSDEFAMINLIHCPQGKQGVNFFTDLQPADLAAAGKKG
jgi:hypothetical protein